VNIIYLGENNLVSNGIIYLLSENFNGSNVQHLSVITSIYTSGYQACDIIVIDDECIAKCERSVFTKLSTIDTPVLLLTSGKSDVRYLHEALPTLRGIIERDSKPELFIKAINMVAAGGYCYSWYVLSSARAIERYFDEDACKKAKLTSREKEILKLCLAGETNKSISSLLSRSEKTVSAHKSNLLKKLGLKNWQLKTSAMCSKQ
jgi:DNA-binding NarL/FixJ family response regulator